MQRIVLFIVAILCLIGSLIALPTPLPIGLILFAVGIALLVMTSNTVRNWLRTLRSRFPRFDDKLDAVSDYLPRPLQRALRMSAPRRHKAQ